MTVSSVKGNAAGVQCSLLCICYALVLVTLITLEKIQLEYLLQKMNWLLSYRPKLARLCQQSTRQA
jgi:hypothetical protein